MTGENPDNYNLCLLSLCLLRRGNLQSVENGLPAWIREDGPAIFRRGQRFHVIAETVGDRQRENLGQRVFSRIRHGS